MSAEEVALTFYVQFIWGHAEAHHYWIIVVRADCFPISARPPLNDCPMQVLHKLGGSLCKPLLQLRTVRKRKASRRLAANLILVSTPLAPQRPLAIRSLPSRLRPLLAARIA